MTSGRRLLMFFAEALSSMKVSCAIVKSARLGVTATSSPGCTLAPPPSVERNCR